MVGCKKAEWVKENGCEKWLKKKVEKKNKLAEMVVKLVRHMVLKKAKGLAELVEENGGK